MGIMDEGGAGRQDAHGKRNTLASGEQSPTTRTYPHNRIDMSRVKIGDACKWLARRLEKELGTVKDIPVESCVAILKGDAFLERTAFEDSLSEFVPTALAITADLWDYLTSAVESSTSPKAKEEREDLSNGKLSDGGDKAFSSESRVADEDRETISKPVAENDKAGMNKDASEGLDGEINPNEKGSEQRKNGAVYAPQTDSVDIPPHQSNQRHPKDVREPKDARQNPTDREKRPGNNLADADALGEGYDSPLRHKNQSRPNDFGDGQDTMKDPNDGEKPSQKNLADADALADGYDSRAHQSDQSHPKDIGDGQDAMKAPKDGEKPLEKNLADADAAAEDYDLREAVLSYVGKPLKGKSDEVTPDVGSHSQRASRSMSARDDSRERRRRRRRRRREYDDEAEREYRRHRRHRRRSRSISRSPSPQRSPSEERERERRREERRARRREREPSRDERRRARKRRHEDDISRDRDDHNPDEDREEFRKQRSNRDDDDESDYRRRRRKRRRHDDREESAEDFESERYRERRHHQRDRSRRGDRDHEDRRQRRLNDFREDRYTSDHRHDRYCEEERERHRDADVPRRNDDGRYERPGYDDRGIRSDRYYGNDLRMEDGSFRHVPGDSNGFRGEDPRQSRSRYNDEKLGDQRNWKRRESRLRQSEQFHRGPGQHGSGRHERNPAQTGVSKSTDRRNGDHVGTSKMYEPQVTSTPWNASADVEVSGQGKPLVKARVQKKISTLRLDRLRSKALASMGKKTMAKENEKTIWDPTN